jgi:hypothetical protein
MSCWVVPTVAAELWGCSLESVLAQIRHGHLQTKEEGGWTFIDVAPESPRMPSVAERQVSQLAAVVTVEEQVALVGAVTDGESDESESQVMEDWKLARRRAAETRQAPQRIAA